MAFSSAGYAVLSAALTLALAGLFLGNFPLLALSALPFLTLVAGTTRADAAPQIRRRISATRVRKGEEFEIEVEVEVPPALAYVEVHQPLPPEVAVASGSTVHLVACRRDGARRVSFRLKCRAATRGALTIPPVRYEVVGLLGLEAPTSGDACGAELVDVVARGGAFAGRNARNVAPQAAASAFDVSRLGVRGTEYKELRRYQWGDPPKIINWKATVRRMRPGARVTPLVNEYEREGKRTVFVFLDASRDLDVGTSVETALDHAVDAAQGIADHFLARGYRVGACAFNHARGEDPRRGEPVYPDMGPAHGERIREAFQGVRPGEREEGLAAAVERSHGHLRQSPFVVVVTRVREPVEPLLEGVRRLRGIVGGSATRRLPVLVVSVRPHGILPAEGPRAAEARALHVALDAARERRVAEEGPTVLPWDPAKGAFGATFLRRIRA